MIIREKYLEKIRPFYELDLIKVLIGIRRCGKSVLLNQIVEELKNSNIEIAYGIDKNASGIYTDINMVTPEENLEKVDAIIVTPVFFFDEIEEELSKKIDCPIISLEDILYEM